MPEILTELPDEDFHYEQCDCSHYRIDHYDEHAVCLIEDCDCPKFEEKEVKDA